MRVSLLSFALSLEKLGKSAPSRAANSKAGTLLPIRAEGTSELLRPLISCKKNRPATPKNKMTGSRAKRDGRLDLAGFGELVMSYSHPAA